MSASFTDGTTAVQPIVIDGWESVRTVRTVVQQVVGGGVDAWLQPAAPRSGTLSAIFFDAADAFALEALLAAGTVLTFADTDRPNRAMTFVAQDSINVTQGDDIVQTPGGDFYVWSVGFGFQEVTP